MDSTPRGIEKIIWETKNDHFRFWDFGSSTVLCESQAYLEILSYRSSMLREFGHADWARCVWCKGAGDTKVMVVVGRGIIHDRFIHRPCQATRIARWRRGDLVSGKRRKERWTEKKFTN